jgi:hypothetical protein
MGGVIVDREGLLWSAHGEQGGRRRRANWREIRLLKVLDQKRKVGEARTVQAMMAARWRPGRARAEAGQRGARGRRLEEEN